MSASVDQIVAIAEDEPVLWTAKDLTRSEARRLGRSYIDEGGRLADYHVTAKWMRPWSADEDCDSDSHAEDGREHGNCTCYPDYVDGAWHYQCEKTHPLAFPVWRVEWIG